MTVQRLCNDDWDRQIQISCWHVNFTSVPHCFWSPSRLYLIALHQLHVCFSLLFINFMSVSHCSFSTSRLYLIALYQLHVCISLLVINFTSVSHYCLSTSRPCYIALDQLHVCVTLLSINFTSVSHCSGSMLRLRLYVTAVLWAVLPFGILASFCCCSALQNEVREEMVILKLVVGNQ